MTRFITIGGATQDIFLSTPHISVHTAPLQPEVLLLGAGTKIESDGIAYQTGGGATNSAVAFARLGIKTNICALIGNDHHGALIRTTLEKEQVDTQYLIAHPTHQTGTSFVLKAQSGHSTIIAYRGANSYLTKDLLEDLTLAPFSCVYITSLSDNSAQLLPSLVQLAHKHGALVANNPGVSQLKPPGLPLLQQSIPYLDVLILNAHEAALCAKTLMANTTPTGKSYAVGGTLSQYERTTFAKYLLSQGLKIVVLTNGKHGVHTYTNEGHYFHPSIATSIVDTLGAGDAFGATFVATIAQGGSIATALRSGVLNSTSVISHTGGKQGLLLRTELTQRLQQLDDSLLHKTTW